MHNWINSKYIDILSPEFYGWQQWSAKCSITMDSLVYKL